ncbi:hypothetical protein VNO77_01879 [Canavalia gladiata]|uniref:Uncharacterized protein n=1 Tax=Canavalia gladiata TaxID=3824 RepID=A0AAN9MSP7_CANGL
MAVPTMGLLEPECSVRAAFTTQLTTPSIFIYAIIVIFPNFQRMEQIHTKRSEQAFRRVFVIDVSAFDPCTSTWLLNSFSVCPDAILNAASTIPIQKIPLYSRFQLLSLSSR